MNVNKSLAKMVNLAIVKPIIVCVEFIEKRANERSQKVRDGDMQSETAVQQHTRVMQLIKAVWCLLFHVKHTEVEPTINGRGHWFICHKCGNHSWEPF